MERHNKLMVHISLNVGLLSSVTIMFQNGHFQDLYSLSHVYLGKIKTIFFLAPLIFRARQTAGYLIVNIFLKIPFQHPNFRSAAFPLHLLFSSQSLDQSSTTLSHGAAPGRNASLWNTLAEGHAAHMSWSILTCSSKASGLS